MRTIGRRPWRLAPLLLLLASLPAAALDLELYAELLEGHSREVPDLAGTRVDYARLGRDPGWAKLRSSLAASRPEALGSRAERLAFWINAYNILAIDVVLGSYPVESIRDVGSLLRPVWKREAGRIGGRSYTLHEIEHGILRPMGDPRIHGAIVCASLSCPPLLREPFRASELERQLETSLQRWLADPRKGLRIDRAAERVELSRIFQWFEEDFAASGGVLAFAARYAPEADRSWLQEHAARARIRYLDYDWSLNDLAGAG